MHPCVGKIPWRRERLPTPAFWPGEFHRLYIVHGVTKSQTRLSDFHSLKRLSINNEKTSLVTQMIKNPPAMRETWARSLGQEDLLEKGSPWGFPSGSVGKESESEIAQSCPTLCDSLDCKLPGSSIHGIFQAKILEWVAISFSVGKESACSAGDMGLIPRSGRSPGEGNDNPLQYSSLENSMERGAEQASVHEMTKSRT